MKLRDRGAVALVLVAVGLLLHVGISSATSSVSVPHVPEAKFASVFDLPVKAVIFQVYVEVIAVIHLKFFWVSNYIVRIRRLERGSNWSWLRTLWNNRGRETVNDEARSDLSIFPEPNYRGCSEVDSWRFAITRDPKVPLYFLASLDLLRFEMRYPNVGSLIVPKLTLRSLIRFLRQFNYLSGQTRLPSGQSSIKRGTEKPKLWSRTVFFVVGCALALGGVILLFKVLSKVYLDPRFNVGVAIGGAILAFAMFLFGWWIVFNVLGLLA